MKILRYKVVNRAEWEADELALNPAFITSAVPTLDGKTSVLTINHKYATTIDCSFERFMKDWEAA